MKTKFKDFINESKTNKSYDDFLSHLIDTLKKDFKDTEPQAKEFIIQYEEELKKAYANDYTVEEAIASTQRPGVKIDEGKIDESIIFQLDDLFENAHAKIKKSTTSINECKKEIKNYYKTYADQTFSDVRLFERVRNNYKSLINLYYEKKNKL
jgi:fructose-bisphosphate aldolase class 1